MAFHLFVSSLIYFSNILYFPVCKSLSSMFKFINKYLTLFDAIVNEIFVSYVNEEMYAQT